MVWRTHRFDSMGTVVSIMVRMGDGCDEALAEVEAVFRSLDETFSLYRDDSELSRIARHELPLTASSPTVKDAYETALTWRATTRGAFTPNRPDGVVDLNGVVKAMAIESAGRVLGAAGAVDWCVNAGGDVLYDGFSPEKRDWVTGITDPADRGSLLASVALFGQHRAAATSGFSERGDHVWLRGDSEKHFAQVTVFAPNILLADVVSTAVLAAPAGELDDLAGGHSVDVLAVFSDGGLVVTPRLRVQLAA
ncbi:MAG: FAD:protein FMN transferase [Lacisediminihabitans sp.]